MFSAMRQSSDYEKTMRQWSVFANILRCLDIILKTALHDGQNFNLIDVDMKKYGVEIKLLYSKNLSLTISSFLFIFLVSKNYNRN